MLIGRRAATEWRSKAGCRVDCIGNMQKRSLEDWKTIRILTGKHKFGIRVG